jgi:AT-binding transcription factor 1
MRKINKEKHDTFFSFLYHLKISHCKSLNDKVNKFIAQLTDSGIDFSTLFDEKKSRPRKRKLGTEFRRSLEGYGFELVSQFVENIQHEKIDYIPDDKITELRQQFLEINRDSVPLEAIQAFAENLRKAIDSVSDDQLKYNGENEETEDLVDDEDASSPPDPKRTRTESISPTSPASTPRPAPSDLNQQLMATMMGLPMMGNSNGANPFMSPEMFQAAFASMMPGAMSMSGDQNIGDSSLNGSSPQKRARTRITDDQLKVLRQYFDINNSPTEQQVKEMSIKAGLPEKVIKHWFRNTLFKGKLHIILFEQRLMRQNV